MIEMWTIYKHPRDFPDKYVARKHCAMNGRHWPTEELFAHADLKAVREFVRKQLPGSVCLPRHGNDDWAVLETWL